MAGRSKQMKNLNDPNGNETCDFAAYRALPQQTAPSRTPFIYICILNINTWSIKYYMIIK
jgi:hypothetical protein